MRVSGLFLETRVGQTDGGLARRSAGAQSREATPALYTRISSQGCGDGGDGDGGEAAERRGVRVSSSSRDALV